MRGLLQPAVAGVLWFLSAVLLVPPVVYFLQNYQCRTFLNNVMPNWFAAAAGIVAGVPVALSLARWQQRRQEDKEAAKRRAEDAMRRQRLLLRLAIEQKSAVARLGELGAMLRLSKHARQDLWAWALRNMDALSFDAIRRLRESDLVDPLDENWSQIDIAWFDLSELQGYVRQAGAAHDFFYGFLGSEERADALQNSVRERVAEVRQSFESASAVLENICAGSWDDPKAVSRWIIQSET